MPKILIVEDNELSRDMLSRRLRRKGYEVLVATDGQEGIAMAQRELPDLVLMDLSLPDLDGWEATRRLKTDAKTQAIPVIALTAHAMSGDREKALDAGCDEYDTKPIDLRRLLSKMVRFVDDPDPGEQRREVAGVTAARARSTAGLSERTGSIGPR
jgi:two-component system cell cycle response regulator DivK